VSVHDEWPIVGTSLGFPSIAGVDAGLPPRCGPVIAHRLQLLYNDVLRQFDQVYISDITPTNADYLALLASIPSGSSAMNGEVMGILPRFSHTYGADLEAHHVPQHVITFVEQNREHLQRAAQGMSGFRAGLTFTKNAPPDNRTQVNHASALQTMARPQQFMPGHHLQQLQRQGLVQRPAKPNTLPRGQLFNSVGPLVSPSMARSISASGIPSRSAQMAGYNSSGGVQNQGGNMSISMNGTSGSIHSMQIRRLTREDAIAAKRLVNEKKRMTFNCG
jgi:hypothetical protein